MGCSKHRGVRLLNSTYKTPTQLVARYLEPYAEEILRGYQCGFRTGRSTTYHIFCLRIISEKSYGYNMHTHQANTDYKLAYDNINRQEEREIMKEFGIQV